MNTVSKIFGRNARQIAFFALLASAHSWAEAGTVAIDIELNPTGDFTAKTAAVKGTAKKDGAAYVSPKLMLDLDTLNSGIELRDKHMKDNYFETKKNKLNKWAVITNARGEGGKFTATLMIRGQKKPVEGTYEVEGTKLTATFKTKLSDYKIKKASYMGVGVVDEVTVKAEIPVGTGAKATKPAKPAKSSKTKTTTVTKVTKK